MKMLARCADCHANFVMRPLVIVAVPSTFTRLLAWTEIQEVFDSWQKQAAAAGESAALLWNQLLSDLRMKAESGSKH